MRTRTCIDGDWRFALGDSAEAVGAGFDERGWRTLDLPHDWSIEATPHPDNPAGAAGGFFPGGIGWYRKRLAIPADLGNRHVLIEFDGIYMNGEVWCNGHLCGVRPYGYSSVCYDLTPHVRAGEPACIAVRVDNSRQKNSRWYSGSGIYRHVWLTVAGPVRVAHWGTRVTTPEVSPERAVVACAVSVLNESGSAVEVSVECAIHGLAAVATGDATSCSHRRQTGDAVCVASGSGRLILGSDPRTLVTSVEIPRPRLWSPDTPQLYTLRVTLRQSGAVIDTCDTRFGVRTIRFDANEGFSLNGQSLKFKGVNEHHDAGCLGAAVPDDVIRRRFRILKDMGCNAIRVAHNPASPAFLDLCDELGFLVVEDAFDEWKDGKTPFGYSLYWDQWWECDLADMIRRDRNHPSIVMWSVGNEIKEVREGRPEGLPIMQALREVCHREDPTRPMTCGCCNSRETLAAGYGALMDVFGYNGGGGGCFDYEKDHAAYPAMAMFASEHPHTLQTRGVYRTRTWYRDLARNRDNVSWHAAPCGAGSGDPPSGDGGHGDDGDGNGGHGREGRGGCSCEGQLPGGIHRLATVATATVATGMVATAAKAVEGAPSTAVGRIHALASVATEGCVATAAKAVDRPPLELMEIPHLTADELFTGFDGHYQSSYGNAVVRMSIRDSWHRTRRLPFFCGEFRWTGFDYLGECYGWPAKSWNFGIVDLCGFPKDAYYFYQSQWADKPMVHILPHWTWPGMEGKVIPVIAYSNCERVELFLNGESLGAKAMDATAMQLRWDVPYQPGVLKAVGSGRSVSVCAVATAAKAVEGAGCPPSGDGGYGDGGYREGSHGREGRGRARDGEVHALAGEAAQGPVATAAKAVEDRSMSPTCVHETAGAPAALALWSDETAIRADRTGIAHITITVVDRDGRFVPHANPDIAVEVVGPAQLIGLENGDPVDSTNYRANHRRAFHGMLLAIVQAGCEAGRTTIRASAPGLQGGECEVGLLP